MKVISGKKLCKILEKKGWSLVRIQGSHFIYGRSDNEKLIVVPVHGNKDLNPGLLMSIMKIANIVENDL